MGKGSKIVLVCGHSFVTSEKVARSMAENNQASTTCPTCKVGREIKGIII